MSTYDTWTVTNTSPDAHTLGQWNSVCTISNGYLGLKGNLSEQRDGYLPVTLINGVYDELDMFSLIRPSHEPRRYLDSRYFDTAGKSPAVANLPNPLSIRVFIGEREMSLGRGTVEAFSQHLDLRCGLYQYSFQFRDGAGRTTRVEMQRFAALRHAHRVFMRYTLTPLDHDAPVRLLSGISGEVRSNLTGERSFTVSELWASPPPRCHLTAQLPAREHVVRVGVAHVPSTHTTTEGPVGITEHDAVHSQYFFPQPVRGQPIVLERYLALTCSEDLRHGLVADLDHELDAAVALGFDAALADQRSAWQPLWQRCDVQIDGDSPAQLGLRFCLYHLLAAGPRFSDRLSVPVKLLTGEYYQGNTFYDTDLFILPFYTLTQPALARTCLRFRYEGLRPGREVARNLGYDGAKLAWQAGPSGEECLGRWWRFPHSNIHVNADVAHALTHYVHATGDQRFLAEHGVDLLVETARFFASRAVYDATRTQYHLANVAGPDEGHCDSTNNFYTNVMAARNLRWAAEMLAQTAQSDPAAHAAAARRLALRPDEADEWRRVADRLTLLYDPQTKLYEQCAGFHNLRPLPANLLEARKTWFVTVAPYQALNQPDVLLALVLLRDECPLDVRRANWEYYKDKSLNFSSMSFAINAIMAADVGDLAEAYKNFIITTGMDLDEGLTGRRDTHSGLHGTAAAGAWLAAVLGFGGVHLSERGLRIHPTLPPQWDALRFNLVLRGVTVAVAINQKEVVLTAGPEGRLDFAVDVAGQAVQPGPGQTCAVRYRT